MKNLFDDFESVTAERWKQQIAKDLKGISFEQLAGTDDSGITINPFYNSENSGSAKSPLFCSSNWNICSIVSASDEKEANKSALRELSYGADSLTLAVSENCNINALLENISIQHIRLNFVFSSAVGNFMDNFQSYVQERKIDSSKLNGAFIFDPVNAVVLGKNENISEKWNDWKKFVTHELFSKPGLTPFAADAYPYHYAGANAVTELACTLAHLNEQLNFIHENNISSEGKDFLIVASVSTNFFESLSKLRALRKLAEFLLSQYGMKNRIFIHAANSLINKTVRDQYNNLIRSTIEGMSAALGGADSVTLFPYDFVSEKQDGNARRLAVNQLMIFKDEAFLSAVSDAGAGSFFIEDYSKQIAEKAWKEFKEIEKKGGMIKYAESGELKKKISAEAEKLRQDYLSGKKILTGVNKFRNEKEVPAKRTFSSAGNEKGLGFFIAEEFIEKQLSEIKKEHA